MPSPPRNPRRRGSTRRRAGSHLPPVQSQETHNAALQQIRAFLQLRSAYDLLPVSFRIIVFDTELEIKKGLDCMVMNCKRIYAHRAARPTLQQPSYPPRSGTAHRANSRACSLCSTLSISYSTTTEPQTSSPPHSTQSPSASPHCEVLSSLLTLYPAHPQTVLVADIENSLGVPQPPLLAVQPHKSLYEASALLIKTHARRLPLIDRDSITGKASLVSVLTQYRLLRFIARNCQSQISQLHVGLRRLKIGTYVDPKPDDRFYPIATARMDTTVFDVVHMFSERGISAVPILDDNGVVVNLYETVDVISLVSDGAYQNLDLTIASALNKRSPDFPGVIVCTENDSLATLLSLLRQRRVHRLVVVEGDPSSAGLASSPSQTSLHMASMTAEPPVNSDNSDAPNAKVPGRLLGIITLSDVLRHIVGDADAAVNSTRAAATAPPSAVDTPAAQSPTEQQPPPIIVEPVAAAPDDVAA